MPLQPGHHPLTQTPIRFRWSNEEQQEMIADLGWDTLQKRRDLARLSMMYLILHNLVDIPVEPYLSPSTSMTRGHDSCFHYCKPEKNIINLKPNPNHEQHLPTELLSKNYCLLEPTPSDCSKPDNVGGLPEPAGNPHLLNATPCFYPILTTVHTSFIRDTWASSTTLLEYSSTVSKCLPQQTILEYSPNMWCSHATFSIELSPNCQSGILLLISLNDLNLISSCICIY